VRLAAGKPAGRIVTSQAAIFQQLQADDRRLASSPDSSQESSEYDDKTPRFQDTNPTCCTIMQATLSSPIPRVEILNDEDYFEVEMFGLPLSKPNVSAVPCSSSEDGYDSRSEGSSLSTSEYLSSSSESLEDVRVDTPDFDETCAEDFGFPVTTKEELTIMTEVKKPVTFNNYFSQYEESTTPPCQEVVRDRVAAYCSTEGQYGSGNFAVKMSLESPLAMDDEEYMWMMNV
jgi:hypothetical protein